MTKAPRCRAAAALNLSVESAALSVSLAVSVCPFHLSPGGKFLSTRQITPRHMRAPGFAQAPGKPSGSHNSHRQKAKQRAFGKAAGSAPDP